MSRKTARRGNFNLASGTCPSGKIRYATEAKARKALRQGRGNAESGVRKVYPCQRCGGYHLSRRRHKDRHPPRERP